MFTVNKCIFTCGVGTDVELKEVGGSKVASCRVAMDPGFVKKGSDPEVTWINLDVWGRAAEALSKYAKKGTRLYIEDGELRSREWEGKTYFSIRANDFKFVPMGGGKKNDDEPAGKNKGKGKTKAAVPEVASEEDIPF